MSNFTIKSFPKSDDSYILIGHPAGISLQP